MDTLGDTEPLGIWQPQWRLPDLLTDASINSPKSYKATSGWALYNDDCLKLLDFLPDAYVDVIFADPPYMLSNNGFTCQNGRMVSVNKGKWDRSRGVDDDLAFHEAWLSRARRVLKPDGTLWVSGTYHSIYQCGYLLQRLGFHILNDIAWFKPNASPNLSCRFFTASHETLIWARQSPKGRHYFDYTAMKEGQWPEDPLKKPGLQMRSVWSLPTPAPREKIHGKHPTQKPLALLLRILRASSKPGDIILDPFNGSGTTGVATKILGERKYIGIELEEAYLNLTIRRLEEIDAF